MIFSMGEALIDFIPNESGVGLQEVTGFQKAPGGGPANVASAVAILGGDSAYIGKIGLDPFGDFLVDTLTHAGVDTSHVIRTDEAMTGLAFVSLKKDGNRDFMFYRNPAADMLLSADEIQPDWFTSKDILHFCSVDLIDAPVRGAHRSAITAIHEKGGIVCFDPNVRLPLWPSPDACREAIRSFLPGCEIVKISDEELAFVTGHSDEEQAFSFLFEQGVRLIVYTMGKQGAALITRTIRERAGVYPLKTIDTTGAGDAFIGSFLFLYAEMDITPETITLENASKLLDFANAAASISTTQYGAISSYPTRPQVASLQASMRPE